MQLSQTKDSSTHHHLLSYSYLLVLRSARAANYSARNTCIFASESASMASQSSMYPNDGSTKRYSAHRDHRKSRSVADGILPQSLSEIIVGQVEDKVQVQVQFDHDERDNLEYFTYQHTSDQRFAHERRRKCTAHCQVRRRFDASIFAALLRLGITKHCIPYCQYDGPSSSLEYRHSHL